MTKANKNSHPLRLKHNPNRFSQFSEKSHPRPISPDVQAKLQRLEQEVEQLRPIAQAHGVITNQGFQQEYVQPTERAHLDVIEEMAQQFDAPEEEIKKKFLDPLRKDFRPAQLPPEWWEEQQALMTKASPIMREKIKQKVENVQALQRRQDERAKALADEQQCLTLITDISRDELFRALEEPQFRYWRDLHMRGAAGDEEAEAEGAAATTKLRKRVWAELNKEFSAGRISNQEDLRNVVRNAVHVALTSLGKGSGTPVAIKTPTSSTRSPETREPQNVKALPKDAHASLEDAFKTKWGSNAPRPKVWDALKSKWV